MFKFIELKKIKDDKYKYKIVFLNLETNKEKTVKFGGAGYNDYIIYNQISTPEEADKKKELYIKRHEKNEDWKDPFSRGALSLYLLWNKRTLKASLNDYLSKFKSIIK